MPFGYAFSQMQCSFTTVILSNYVCFIKAKFRVADKCSSRTTFHEYTYAMKTFLIMIAGIFVGMILSGIVWISARQPDGEAVTLRPPPTSAPISVHITGAVLSPGLYDLPKGSRVVDVINAAGGFLPIADNEQVNLAALVEDGSKIEIGKRSTYDASGGGSNRININIATLEELDTLPGIGTSTAQAIIDHRRQFGDFQRTDEITNVTGIGNSTYDRIKDMIRVE